MITLDLVNVLGTTRGDANNSILYTVGDILTGDEENSVCNYLGQTGFYSLPPNPVPGKYAPEAVRLRGVSNRDLLLNIRDVNSQSIYANLQPGEAMMAGTGADGTGVARVKCDAKNTITLATTDDGTASGNAVSLTISPTMFSFFAPWGKFTFDKTGFHISTVDGARFDLTPTADPTSGGNACNITAGNITLNSGVVNLGPSTGVYFPAAISMLPVAAPFVPLTGEGVGAVLLNVLASPVVNICGVAV